MINIIKTIIRYTTSKSNHELTIQAYLVLIGTLFSALAMYIISGV